MVNLDNYKKEDGRYDWNAYHRAQVNAGERCTACRQIIIFGNGYPSKCNDCERIQEDADEVSHDSRIRCPKCRHTSPIDDRYELYSEGEHDVSCDECGHDFQISTYVSHSFRSPALLPEQETQE